MKHENELSAALAARDHAVQQAQQHAVEALTQRGTVLNILEYFGCPAEDWNALPLIKAAIARSVAAQQHAQSEHRPGCDALGGYGNGIGPCSCGTQYTQAALSEGEQPFPHAFPHSKRVEMASALLSLYSDTNLEKLLDYDVQPIIRKLAAMIGQWQQAAVDPYLADKCTSQQPAAVPNAPAIEPMEDPVTVPRGLLGSACHAIVNKKDAPNTLEKLRSFILAKAPAAPSCFLCHGTGQYQIPTAVPAGVDQPTPMTAECQQCKAPATPAIQVREEIANDLWNFGEKYTQGYMVGHADGYAACERRSVKDERVTFEAWIIAAFDECGEDDPNLALDKNGRYTSDMRVLTAWQVWQARAALAAPAPVQPAPVADSLARIEMRAQGVHIATHAKIGGGERWALHNAHSYLRALTDFEEELIDCSIIAFRTLAAKPSEEV